MPSLFGWGGVKIYTTEFTTSYGNLSFERVDVRNTTIDGKVIVHHKGWRAVIETELINASAADAAKLATLASLIGQSQDQAEALTIYPRYTSTDAGSQLSYSCFLDSDFSPEDIANVDVGQTIKLRWISEDLLTTLPTNYSNIEESYTMSADTSDDYIMWDDTADDYLMLNTGV